METKNKELLACPFCGKSDLEFRQTSEAWLWCIMCENCGVSTSSENHHSDGFKERLWDKWNQRHEPKTFAQLALDDAPLLGGKKTVTMYQPVYFQDGTTNIITHEYIYYNKRDHPTVDLKLKGWIKHEVELI